MKRLPAVFTILSFAAMFGFAVASASDGEPIVQRSLGIAANMGKWPGGVINWVYNPTGAPPGWTDSNYTLGEFEKALSEWEGVCNVTFVGRGVDPTATNGGAADGEVVFVWDSAIGGAAGQAGPNWAESGAILTANGLYPYIDGSLKMNPNSFALVGATAAQIEQSELAFNNTAVHEVGHMIGFGHSDNPVSRMYANPYNSLSHIRQDDIDGCQALYGKPANYIKPAKYVPLASGANPFSSIFLVNYDANTVQITSVDNEEDHDLGVRFDYTATSAEDLSITSVVVDPAGYKNIVNSRTISLPSAGNWSAAFSMTSFDRLRQLPGLWTVYVIMNGQVVSTQTVNVTTSLPDYNEPPVTLVSIHDNPTTRVVTVTVDALGDGDLDTQNVTVITHMPTVGAPSETFIGSTGQEVQAVDYNDLLDHEIFVEVNDDGPRYSEDLPNNIGPAGSGFQFLYRYVSKDIAVKSDSDGNKTSDIVLRNIATGADHMYKMNGTSISQSVGIDTVSDLNWKIVGRGDYNGDGKSDILWRHAGSGTIWLYLMNGHVRMSSGPVGTVANLNWQIVGDGDYNGDGMSDILWRDTVNGTIWLYQMNSFAVSLSVGIGTQPDLNWQIKGSGDYDGDGNDDILWRNAVSGTNWMYLMNGPTIMSSVGVSVAPDVNWKIVASGDFNGDSRSDILWRHGLSGTNWVYLMNGTSIQASASISVLPDLNWTIVGAGDYNGDGYSDVLWRNVATGSNYMYLMNGLNITANAQVSVVSDQNWKIVHIQ